MRFDDDGTLSVFGRDSGVEYMVVGVARFRALPHFVWFPSGE